jgi:putative ABC transport system permease protein
MARSSLSQNHWAIRLGISRGHWSEIVNGKHPYPSPKTRERMLEIFGVDFDALFEMEAGPTWTADPTFKAAIAHRYLVDEEVGHGGMGTVYLARDVKLGRRVAIKSLSPEAVSGIGFEQLLKEIRFTARLQHQHILPLYDAGEAAGHPYYVMPYVADGSLRRLIARSGRIALDETLRIASAVGHALEYAHGEHILHCDIKPENVLLQRGHVYVADFGVARAIHAEIFEWGRRPDLDSSAGTPAYVSPEQASGERNLDGRADVYSLACMVFEMLTGVAPFTGRTSMEIVAQRFTSPVPDVRRGAPGVPAGVAGAIERGMSLVPARRTSSAQWFVHDLTTATQPRGDATHRVVGAFGHLRSWFHRRGLWPVARAPSPRGHGFTEGLRQDVRLALRSLRRAPGFALITVLTLALGIGAQTAIFTIVNGTLLRPLPYAEPNQLVLVWEYDSRAGQLAAERRAMSADSKWTVSPANFVRWRERARSFADMAAFNLWHPTLSGEGDPEELAGAVVTPNFFDVMGVGPVLGHGFSADQGTVGLNRVVLISEALWRRRFGADPNVVGSSVRLSGDVHTIVGVIPASYRHPDPSVIEPVDVWRPIAFEEPRTSFGRFLRVVARLTRSTTLEMAVDEMRGIAADLAMETPDENRGWEARVVALREDLFGKSRLAMVMLLGAAGFVLLIACTNVANMVLARSHGRQKEFAVRTALGAGRGRLARQLIVENALLALGGGVLGLAGVRAGMGFLRSIQGHYLSSVADIRIDLLVVTTTVGVALAVGVAFGLLPIMQVARGDLRVSLMEGGAGVSRGARRLRTGFVVSQISLAAVLVVGAGLLVRSFVALMGVSPGFERHRILTSGVVLPAELDDRRQETFFEQLLPRVEAIPGIEGAALISDLPFTTENRFMWVNPTDHPKPDGEELLLEYHTVGSNYFHTMGIALRAGRDFGSEDRLGTNPVIVVNEALADLVWPGQSALGKQAALGRADSVAATVVGIVDNTLDDGLDSEVEPRLYRSYAQYPERNTAIVMRTRGTFAGLPAAVRREVAALQPDALVREFRTMDAVVGDTVAEERIAVSLAGVFSTLALLLAAVGIYGVMSYSIGERRREIGVRSALGAQRTDVIGLILRQSLVLTAVGTGLGIAAALALSRTLSSFLFSVRILDAPTLLGTIVLLASVAVLASYVPAVRAVRVPPTEALRSER